MSAEDKSKRAQKTWATRRANAAARQPSMRINMLREPVAAVSKKKAA